MRGGGGEEVRGGPASWTKSIRVHLVVTSAARAVTVICASTRAARTGSGQKRALVHSAADRKVRARASLRETRAGFFSSVTFRFTTFL